MSEQTGQQSQQVPADDEPGGESTPLDTEGAGPVGLEDRMRTDEKGSPATNQAKAEPMPPTPGHADPAGTGPHTNPPAVPELGEMSAGMAMAQVASPPVLPPRPVETARTLDDGSAHGGDPGTVPALDRPHLGTSTSTGSAAGPELPESQTTGTAHRAVGQQGETPDGESVESDTAVGAARMAPGGGPDRTAPPQDFPGDSRGVNVPHEQAAPGTSEEQGIVHGVKDPAR